MKSIHLALTLAALAFPLAACTPDDSAYDPKLDGVLPSDRRPPDLSILEDQKAVYQRANPPAAAPASRPATTPAPKAATPAPAPAAPAAPATPVEPAQ